MILKDVLKTIIDPDEVIRLDFTSMYTTNNSPLDCVLVILWFKNKTVWQGLYTDIHGFSDDQEILIKSINRGIEDGKTN